MKAEQKDALQKTEVEESIGFGKNRSTTGKQQREPRGAFWKQGTPQDILHNRVLGKSSGHVGRKSCK